MPTDDHLRILVVDDNAESRMLLTKTLMRKYPEAAVIECQHADTAAKIVGREPVNAVVAHRTFDYAGAKLIALLRRAGPTVPLVAVSGYDGAERARAAGADVFLNYEAWLQIGTAIADAMKLAAARRPPAEGGAPGGR